MRLMGNPKELKTAVAATLITASLFTGAKLPARADTLPQRLVVQTVQDKLRVMVLQAQRSDQIDREKINLQWQGEQEACNGAQRIQELQARQISYIISANLRGIAQAAFGANENIADQNISIAFNKAETAALMVRNEEAGAVDGVMASETYKLQNLQDTARLQIVMGNNPYLQGNKIMKEANVTVRDANKQVAIIMSGADQRVHVFLGPKCP